MRSLGKFSPLLPEDSYASIVILKKKKKTFAMQTNHQTLYFKHKS
jgi:hypothetical protein